MKKALIFAYGIASYAFFLVAFLYAIGFIGNIVVPKSIDSAPIMGFWPSLWTNLGLLALFAVQHSGMARPAFKRWLTRYIPESAERSTYILMSTVCLVLLMAFWAPMGGVVWSATAEWAVWTLYSLYFASWVFLLYSTFPLNHFDLFGLRQVTHALLEKERKPLGFMTPWLYRFVRHPIYTGWLGIMWFTPTMTITHLVFAAVSTGYIFVGMRLEERDLEAAHPEYADYRKQVPALIPSVSRRLDNKAEPQSA